MKTLVIVAALLLAAPCFAQNEDRKPVEDGRFYRLDFVVKDLENGKVVNTRAWNLTIADLAPLSNSSIRNNDRVPVPTGGGNQTYEQVGVNIDCRLIRAYSSQLQLMLSFELTGAAPGDHAPPLLNTTKWSAGVVVPLRKTVTVFSSDSPSAKRQLQLELTATPLQ